MLAGFQQIYYLLTCFEEEEKKVNEENSMKFPRCSIFLRAENKEKHKKETVHYSFTYR